MGGRVCCFYLLDCGEPLLFASGSEVDAFWFVLGELEDGLLSETDIAFAEASVARNLYLGGIKSRRHTAGDEDHLSVERWDILLRVESYPAGNGTVEH